MTISQSRIDNGGRKLACRTPAGALTASLQRRRGHIGFTLVELITVLSLFGVAFAVVVPPFATLARRRATQVASHRFIATHTLARSTAVRFGRAAELHIDASNGRFWIEVDTSQAGGGADTLGSMRHVMPIGRLTMTSDRAVLCFDSRGLPTNRGPCEAADATVVFSHEDEADTVKITALGRALR